MTDTTVNAGIAHGLLYHYFSSKEEAFVHGDLERVSRLLALVRDHPDRAPRARRTGGGEWEPLTAGLPQQNCYVNVLRDAMAVDAHHPCGIYFGTTGGQVYASADAGESWAPIVRDLPAVLSVEVQTLR